MIAPATATPTRADDPMDSPHDEAWTNAPHPLLQNVAPDITAPAVLGGRVSLASLRGQVVIVAFIATWCEACKYQVAELQALPATAGRHTIRVIGVAVDDDVKDVVPYLSSRGVKFPVAYDAGHRIADLYALRTMPATFVLDERGIVRLVHDGFTIGDVRHLINRVAAMP